MIGPPRPLSRREALTGLVRLAGLAGLAAACAPPRPATRLAAPRPVGALTARPDREEWPAVVLRADPNTQTAYRYAAGHRDVLQYVPCYCGCVDEGHRSNWDCFVREVDGPTVELDAHGLNCGTCVGITLDVAAMTRIGVPLREVRARVDARWRKAGPGTKTPFPP
jgi:hypothetical protein